MARKTNKADEALILQKKDTTDQEVEMLKQILPGLIPNEEEAVFDAEAELQTEDGPMDDLELMAVINVYKERARSHMHDEISFRAARSNEFYLAQPEGIFAPPESGNRSNYVDTAVADTINWLKPHLLQVFCGQNNIVEFSARSPAQEKSAEMTTAMVNHVWQTECGFDKAETWIHDTLMQPGGVIKVFWEPKLTPDLTVYKGLTDLQFGMLAVAAEAGEIRVVAHKARKNPAFNAVSTLQQVMAVKNAVATGKQPQLAGSNGQQGRQAAQTIQIDPTDATASELLHDVKVEMLTGRDSDSGCVRIENIPLEEFYFDAQSPSLAKTHYVAHARRLTLSDLRAMGFPEDKLDDLGYEEFDPHTSFTYLERHTLDQTYAWMNDDLANDPSMRRFIVVESYIKVDYDKDGIAEWRKIITCGNTILSNEATDGHPFIMLVANPLPHSAFGISAAEQAQNIQLNQTQLMRSLIDNVSYGVDSQKYAVEGNVNLDDLLDSKPGGIVRVKSPDAVGVLPNSSGDVGAATTLIALLDSVKQERTGVQKLTQGSDADVNNETAAGFYMMKEQAALRIDLMIRRFAETGFKPLALRIQKLLAQYQNEYMQVRLNGQLMTADPMDACNQFDMIARVGLGTNDKSHELAYLDKIMALQQAAMGQSTGMANLNHVHNTVEKMVRAMGFPNAEEFFCKPPAPMPQLPPPQMSPESQALLQIEQMKAQSAEKKQERQAQLDAMRIKAQGEKDDQQAALDHQRAMQKMDAELVMQREKMMMDAAIKREQIAAQAMLNPAQEQSIFNSTYGSTEEAMTAELSKMNMHVSGEMDELLEAIANAPEPDNGI